MIFRSVKIFFYTALISILSCAQLSFAQVEIIDTPSGSETKTGRESAQDYFKVRKKARSSSEVSMNREPAAASGVRYLTLHIGTFVDEGVYKWGVGNSDDVGQLNFGVSYKVGEWVNSMDLLFRADFTTYTLGNGRAQKLSLLPMITFPDANSRFPLYFGGGLGPGIFFKQIDDEGSLSLDYQLVAGARFFDVLNSIGFMFETGIKNHILLLSDGQYNGVFINLGTVFAF